MQGPPPPAEFITYEDFILHCKREGYTLSDDGSDDVYRSLYTTVMTNVQECLSDAVKIAILEADTAGEVVITNPPAPNQVRIFPRDEIKKE